MRRAMASGELVIVLVAGVLLTTASFVLLPKAISAASGRLPPDEPPQSASLLESYTAIQRLLRSAHQLISLHKSEQTGLTDLVLWYRDDDLDGKIDPTELVVLTHSRFLGQMSAASVEWQPSAGDRDFVRLTAPIDPAYASSVDFVAAWRSRSDVSVRVVAVEIDGFGLERLQRKYGQEAWRVWLRWSPNISDPKRDTESSFAIRFGSGI